MTKTKKRPRTKVRVFRTFLQTTTPPQPAPPPDPTPPGLGSMPVDAILDFERAAVRLLATGSLAPAASKAIVIAMLEARLPLHLSTIAHAAAWLGADGLAAVVRGRR